jgi:hypothetical protein
MGFIFIEQAISEGKDASWPVIIGTKEGPQSMGAHQVTKGHDTQGISEIWI